MLVTKYGERYPLSNSIPSTTLTLVCVPLASSTVITPSFPTFAIASAIIFPISLSLLAEIVATCSISELLLSISFEIFFISAITFSTAKSIPFFISTGLAPEVTYFKLLL